MIMVIDHNYVSSVPGAASPLKSRYRLNTTSVIIGYMSRVQVLEITLDLKYCFFNVSFDHARLSLQHFDSIRREKIMIR